MYIQCNTTAALDGFFTQLLQPPQNKLALIGSGCSVATEATAQIAHYYNIIQVYLDAYNHTFVVGAHLLNISVGFLCFII